LGCRVTLLERHPVVAALLADGLLRAYQDAEIGAWLSEHLTFCYGQTLADLLAKGCAPEVVYLDPMYPHRQKSALVKKEMLIFQTLVGSDDDAEQLLAPPCQLAKKRVVVKRPDYAKPLAQQIPHAAIKTKNHRFDLYLPTNS